MRRLPLVIALLTAASLAGCNLRWEKPETESPPPSRFRGASPASARPLGSAHDFVAKFGSKELLGVVDEALASNNDIAAAAARIRQADATARVNSSAIWPSLSLNSTGKRNQTPGTVVPIAQQSYQYNGSARGDLFTLGINASYELDFWGKNEDASKAARLLANASRFDRNVVEIATIASVLNSYFLVLNTRDRLRIARENVRIADGVLKALQIRLQVGTSTMLDVSQQGSVLATQRAAIPQLEETLIQQKNLLAVLLGRPPENFDIKNPTLSDLHLPAVAPGLPSEVLLRRPDIAEAEATLASQEFSVLRARAAFFPSFTLTGQYGLQSIAFRNLLHPEAIAWEVLAGAAQPLFDGANLQGQYELQQGKYAEFAANYKKQTLSALADTENALTAVAKTAQRLKIERDAVEYSRAALEAAQARLRAGTIDIITLSTTETTFFQNRDAFEQARLSRFQAATSLYQALGGGWSPTTREQQIALANEAYAANRGPWP